MPTPRPKSKLPRERRQTEMEKAQDAIVHAVVAVELLHWHGKLGGALEGAFRRCVYEPVLPRLHRLTTRESSAYDDFRFTDGKIVSRPSRVHDATLEKQFTLGNVFTEMALRALGRGGHATWFNRAQLASRREFVLSESTAEEDPAAKDLVSWSSSYCVLDEQGTMVEKASMSVGHNDAKDCIWMLPTFVDHDRSAHAERQAMLVLMELLPMSSDEGVAPRVTGFMRLYASHTPCISCLASMCQFTRAFEGVRLHATYDIWKETRRWIGRPEDWLDQ